MDVGGVEGVEVSGRGVGVNVRVGVNVGMKVEVEVAVTGPKGVGSVAFGSRVSIKKGALKGGVRVAGVEVVPQAASRMQKAESRRRVPSCELRVGYIG